MKIIRLFQSLLTVLPVLTAGLYLLGLTYHQGYLGEFGIDDSIFPLATDKALLAGFLSLVNITFPGLIYAVLMAIGFVLLVVATTVLSSTSRVRALIVRLRKWRVDRFPNSTHPQPAIDLIDRGATAYVYLSGVILILLLLVAIAVLSGKTGREQAEREISEFRQGRSARTEILSAQVEKPYLGKLVQCGEKYCAFWSDAGTVLLRHEVIDRAVIHPPASSKAAPVKAASAP
jgi:hypothetical protein